MTAPCSAGQRGDALAFRAGTLVDVKGRGRATVLETAGSAAAAAAAAGATAAQPPHPFAGRVHVRFHEDGSTYWVNPAHLRCMRPSSARIVVTYRTELFRAAVTHNVEYGCCCLEVGSHTGSTTALLHKRCGGRAVGVDNVPLMVEGARRRFPGVRFELADGADLAALRALSPNNLGSASASSGGAGASASSSSGASPGPASGGGSRSAGPTAAAGGQGAYDIICVDLSGKAPLQAVVPLLSAYLREWPAARLIVKNEALFCLLEAWQQQQQQQQQLGERQQQQQGDHDEALLSQLLAGWRLGGDGGRGGGASRGAGPAALSELAAVLRECELFRSEGFLSQTDKPLNKAKDRRCHYCGAGSIGKWKEHNRQCAAKQAAKAAKAEAQAAAAAAAAATEAGGGPPPSPP